MRYVEELRTGRDSNPRYPYGHTGFRDRPFQPLTHLSKHGWLPVAQTPSCKRNNLIGRAFEAIAVVVLLLTTPAAAQQAGTLGVLPVTPSGDAAPTTEISVVFDRPVAGSLDRSIESMDGL